MHRVHIIVFLCLLVYYIKLSVFCLCDCLVRCWQFRRWVWFRTAATTAAVVAGFIIRWRRRTWFWVSHSLSNNYLVYAFVGYNCVVTLLPVYVFQCLLVLICSAYIYFLSYIEIHISTRILTNLVSSKYIDVCPSFCHVTLKLGGAYRQSLYGG